MSNDTLSLLIVLLLLILVFYILVKISMRLKRGGGSMTTISLGATDEFLNKDRSKAAETIVNQNAGKNPSEEKSAQPKTPGKLD
jgi:hypothetical protein